MKIAIIVISSVIAAVIGIAVLFRIFKRRRLSRKMDEADAWLVNEFRRCNVMVYGKKRQGKDLIFAHVIALRGEKHYANIVYDYNTELITLDELTFGENTYKNFIRGDVVKCEPRFKEGCDIYISDCGIYFPSQYDKELDDFYPGAPIFFALSSQVYGINVHSNSQGFERPWKKLREQADSYIQVLGTKRRENTLYTHIRGYDRYDNAKAETGYIVEYIVRIPIGELSYDSRYFRDVVLNREKTPREKIMEKTSRRIVYDDPKRN